MRILTPIVTLLVLLSAIAHAETLNVVTAFDPLEAEEYITAFENDAGIDVKWIRLSAGEVLARLKAESKNPTQDVWFGGPCPEFVAATNAGLFESYKSPNSYILKPEWHDKNFNWTGISAGAIIFIATPGLTPPESWADLLKPEYKNEIVVSYPYTAGTGYTVLAGLVAIMGHDGAFDYYKKLDGQIRRYTKSGSTPVIEVGLGEAGVGIVFEHDAIRKGQSRGFKMNISYPKEGLPYTIDGMAIIKGHSTPAAKKFVDWALSLKAQNIMHKWYRLPLHPEAIVGEGTKPLNKLNLAPVDFVKIGAEREELIKEWREKVGK